MKSHRVLFFILLIISVYSCILDKPGYRFPVFLTEDYKSEVNIVKNDGFNIFIKPTIETVISDSNYIVPVEIGISNCINETLSLKIKDIEVYLKNKKKKDEVFKGQIGIRIDTTITNLQTREIIPIIVEFKSFNRNYISKITDFDNYTMEIILYGITINKLYFSEKRIFFVCRTH